jgi:hypothetical protein
VSSERAALRRSPGFQSVISRLDGLRVIEAERR